MAVVPANNCTSLFGRQGQQENWPGRISDLLHVTVAFDDRLPHLCMKYSDCIAKTYTDCITNTCSGLDFIPGVPTRWRAYEREHSKLTVIRIVIHTHRDVVVTRSCTNSFLEFQEISAHAQTVRTRPWPSLARLGYR